jgi:hypothetical protein
MLWQYDYGWRELCNFFTKHETSLYSDYLLSQYVMDAVSFKIPLLEQWRQAKLSE